MPLFEDGGTSCVSQGRRDGRPDLRDRETGPLSPGQKDGARLFR